MRLIRNIIAFFAVPAVAVSAYSLVKNFLSFTAVSGGIYMPFWAGVLCYIIFQALFYKPMRTYVFGHELTHAVAGVLSGARIKKFKVSQTSGSVVLTKDNVWITLAPYFFPLYTFIIIVLYIMLGWIADIKLFYSYFLFAAGLSIAFHIALTVYILSIGQPDLKVYGVFFSYVFIIAVNVVVFSVLAALAFPAEIDAGILFTEMGKESGAAYLFMFDALKNIVKAFALTS
jgi:hypothetical protein